MNVLQEDVYSDVSSNRSPPTARSLSPALRAWALRRFAPVIRTWVLVVVGVANMIGGVLFLVSYFFGTNFRGPGNQIETAPEWLLWMGIVWIVLDLGMVGGIVVFAKARGAKKGKQLLALLERGHVGYAQIVANQVDYSIRINGAPRRILALAVEGRPMEIRTFDNNFANLFPEGEVIEVFYDKSIPGMVFPTSQVPAI